MSGSIIKTLKAVAAANALLGPGAASAAQGMIEQLQRGGIAGRAIGFQTLQIQGDAPTLCEHLRYAAHGLRAGRGRAARAGDGSTAPAPKSGHG